MLVYQRVTKIGPRLRRAPFDHVFVNSPGNHDPELQKYKADTLW